MITISLYLQCITVILNTCYYTIQLFISTAKTYTYTTFVQNAVYIVLIRHCKHLLAVVYKFLSCMMLYVLGCKSQHVGYICTRMYIYIYIHICVYMYNTYVYYVCVYIQTHIYIHIYIYIHICVCVCIILEIRHTSPLRESTEVTFGRGDLSFCPLGGLTGAPEWRISDWRGVPQGSPWGQTLVALHCSW